MAFGRQNFNLGFPEDEGSRRYSLQLEPQEGYPVGGEIAQRRARRVSEEFGISFLSAGGGMGRITQLDSGKQGGSYEDNDIFQDLPQI